MGRRAAIIIGLTAAVGLAAAPAVIAAAERGPSPMDARAAVDLSGTWKGFRTDAATGRTQAVTVRWRQARDGAVSGILSAAREASYPVTVVWTNGGRFIIESAPHESADLHERVVVRTVARLDGDKLTGRYEMRPTAYRGWTSTGHLFLDRVPPHYRRDKF